MMKRPELDESRINQCHQIVDDLVRLYRETDPAQGANTEKEKNEKALQALNKIGELAGHLTEWAEHHLFGVYYNIAKSEDKWLDGAACNKHEHEMIWRDGNIPDDAFIGDEQLQSTRAAIADILKNTFSRYGIMGWRMSMRESLYALNEGQVDWLFAPTNSNQQGNAYDLRSLKWAAVKHVYKLVGEGWKKTAARQKIAEMCGTTFETIKKWEREGIKERDKDKSTLKAIEFGSFYLTAQRAACPETEDKDILHEAIMWNKHPEADEYLKQMSYGAITSITLDEDYPLDTLKDRLIEAGMRIAA